MSIPKGRSIVLFKSKTINIFNKAYIKYHPLKINILYIYI